MALAAIHQVDPRGEEIQAYFRMVTAGIVFTIDQGT